MKSCLNCTWLEEPDEPHVYHWCAWPTDDRLPANICFIKKDPINIHVPFMNCPVWEERIVHRTDS